MAQKKKEKDSLDTLAGTNKADKEEVNRSMSGLGFIQTRDILFLFCLYIFIGFGYEQLADFLAAMGMSQISPYLFRKGFNAVKGRIEELSYESLLEAGREEYEMAKAADPDAVGPLEIEVYVDGSWSQRSYNHAYRALSGMVIMNNNPTSS